MKLIRFKCIVCKSEFYTLPDYVEEIRKKDDDPICPFCDPEPGKSISRCFEVGDVEFDDRSKLEADDIENTVEFLKEVEKEISGQFDQAYHRIERLKRQKVEDSGDTNEPE